MHPKAGNFIVDILEDLYIRTKMSNDSVGKKKAGDRSEMAVWKRESRG